MKLVRMTKTMAGPQGILGVGTQTLVTDELAQRLVAAEAAELIGEPSIPEVKEAEILTPDKESAAVESAPEKAVTRKPAAKKRGA